MKWESRHIGGLIIGIIIVILDIIFYRGTPYFIPGIIVAVTIAWSQQWIDFFVKTKMDKELEEKFPEFVRNLVSAVKSGMPMTRALIQVSTSDYGALNPHVQKLANQVEWAIPLHRALMIFAEDTDNYVIKRAISTVIEAERSGGNIEDVLETITGSVLQIKKIKQERKASIHGQVVQTYIIFGVFLAVMIVIQNMLIPYIAGIGGDPDDEFGVSLGAGGGADLEALMRPVEISFASPLDFYFSFTDWLTSLKGVFLMLAGVQGLFAGIILGQLAEGSVRAGIKHSMIMITLAFFLISLAQGILEQGGTALLASAPGIPV